LQGSVQGFDYDAVFGPGKIASEKDFGIAAAAQAFLNPIAIVDYAVFQPQFHGSSK
jgi:hypothetical protein